MREILFRGQTRRYGEKVWMNGEKVPSNWVYGGVCCGEGAFSIVYAYMDEEKEIPIEKHVVYTDTIGQYTGLTDKNGKRIFEGDIVKIHLMDFADIGFIRYANDCCRFQFVDKCSIGYGIDDTDVIEVIGNIHDNPELLKGE